MGKNGDDRHAALGAAVRQRRKELGVTQAEAAVGARVSEPTWNAIELARARNPRRTTLLAVSRYLGWPDDAAEAYLRDKSPIDTEGNVPSDDLINRIRGLGFDLDIIETQFRRAMRDDAPTKIGVQNQPVLERELAHLLERINELLDGVDHRGDSGSGGVSEEHGR